jgi:tetratricopeptide (TPR) repeat protein
MNKNAAVILFLIIVFANLVFSAQNRKQYQAEHFLKKAREYLAKKEFFKSKRFFERSYRKYRYLNDSRGQFEALKGLGDVNFIRGYLDRAFDMYNRAKYFAYQCGMVNTIMFVDLCRNIAYVHESHRYFKNAVMFMEIAVSVGARVGDPRQGYNITYLSKLRVLSNKFGNSG